MALTAGTRVGVYEITGLLGAGGMGEVYRARDTRLGRDVAQDLSRRVRRRCGSSRAFLSPDGKWIAYQSDESGRFEVYVRPFPRVADGRWPVSVNGGTRPLWGRDGRELFYLDQSRRMIVMSVATAPTLSLGQPQTLFETAQLGLEGQQRNFELGSDGKRFLMVKNLPPPSDVPPIVLVQQLVRGTAPESPVSAAPHGRTEQPSVHVPGVCSPDRPYALRRLCS